MIVQNLNYRIPALATTPTSSELTFLLQLALRNPRTIVELPWTVENSPISFLITVTGMLSLEQPRWILYGGLEELETVVWNYDTADTELIYQMITAERDQILRSQTGSSQSSAALPQEPQGNGQSGPTGQHQAPPVVSPGAQSTPGKNKVLPSPIEFDRSAVDTMYKAFTNPETGFISHQAYLFFLVGEFSRFQRHQHSLSIVRFDMRVQFPSDKMSQPLSVQAVRLAGRRIFGLMRTLDWAAHYENEFALLLPYTTGLEAAQIAERIHQALLASPLVPEITPPNLNLSFGIASMPDDCIHPGVLLAAAQEAKNRSKLSGRPVVLFAED